MHTKEPWMAWKDGIDRDIFGPATNYTVGQCFHTPDVDSCAANARRIVACVNRLAAFRTEDIENPSWESGMWGMLLDITQRHDALKQQRDELAQELKNLRGGK